MKQKHNHLYFIATQYYAVVEDIDNWTRSYILISIILYWNRPMQIINVHNTGRSLRLVDEQIHVYIIVSL